jgi:PAS domain S-box-containing protein
VTFTIEEHLRTQGVDASRLIPPPRNAKKPRVKERPVVDYAVKGVPVTLLLTRHNDEARPDRAEASQYLALLNRLLDEFAPDQLIACNGHPMIFEAMARARNRGITTAFAVRGFGYYEPRYFDDVDHAFTCSQFLTDHYRDRVGLVSTAIEPPIDWSATLAPEESRAFVTFVNPSAHKGLLLFARLADMLGYSAEEMIGKSFSEFIPEASEAKAPQRFEGSRGITQETEVKLERNDQSELWVLLKTSPIHDADGAYVGTLAMMTDRTRARQDEESLRKSEEQYRQIVETTTEGIIKSDASARILFVNRRFAEMLGYDPREMVGVSMFDYMSAALGERDECAAPPKHSHTRFGRWR